MPFKLPRASLPQSAEPRRLPNTAEGAGREEQQRAARALGQGIAAFGAELGEGLQKQEIANERKLAKQQAIAAGTAVDELGKDLQQEIINAPLGMYDSEESVREFQQEQAERLKAAGDEAANSIDNPERQKEFRENFKTAEKSLLRELARRHIARQKEHGEEMDKVIDDNIVKGVFSFDGLDGLFEDIDNDPDRGPKERAALKNRMANQAAVSVIEDDPALFLRKADDGDFQGVFGAATLRNYVLVAESAIRTETSNVVKDALAKTQLQSSDFRDIPNSEIAAVDAIGEARAKIRDPKRKELMGEAWSIGAEAELSSQEASVVQAFNIATMAQQSYGAPLSTGAGASVSFAPYDVVVSASLAEDAERNAVLFNRSIDQVEEMIKSDVNKLRYLPSHYRKTLDAWWTSGNLDLAKRSAAIYTTSADRFKAELGPSSFNSLGTRQARDSYAEMSKVGAVRLGDMRQFLALGGDQRALESVKSGLAKETEKIAANVDAENFKRFTEELVDRAKEYGNEPSDIDVKELRLSFREMQDGTDWDYETLAGTVLDEWNKTWEPQPIGREIRKKNLPHRFAKSRASNEDVYKDLAYLMRRKRVGDFDLDTVDWNDAGVIDGVQTWSVTKPIGEGRYQIFRFTEKDLQDPSLPSLLEQQLKVARQEHNRFELIHKRTGTFESKVQLSQSAKKGNELVKMLDAQEKFRAPDRDFFFDGPDYEREAFFSFIEHAFHLNVNPVIADMLDLASEDARGVGRDALEVMLGPLGVDALITGEFHGESGLSKKQIRASLQKKRRRQRKNVLEELIKTFSDPFVGGG